jgi:hypothetical protein
MIKFFRKIRQSLLIENKLSRYLLYAIGEIVLVVIGILIALQVNNLNELKKDRFVEHKLLTELTENLEINAVRLKIDMQQELESIESIDFVVDHLDNRRPYHDSLDTYFRAAFFSPDIVLSTSGFESLKSKGFGIVEIDEVRKSILELFDVTYAFMLSQTIRIEDQFWPSGVIPLLHKHFRVLDDKRFKPVDYEALLNDESYKNMLLHRKHFRELAYQLKSEALGQTESTMALIENELKKRK